MSEFDKMLEDVGRETWLTAGAEDMTQLYDINAVLKRRLLPLLEAGQACRQAIGNYAQELARKQDGETSNDDDLEAAIRQCVQSVKDYKAAKQAAMEGR